MAKTVYMSGGPSLDGAVKMSGNGPTQAHSSPTTSLSGPGMRGSSPGQSLLENATVGSMPVVNTLTVGTNQDGTIGVHTSVADAMPETSLGTFSRNGSASASTGSISSVGVQTGWVQVGNGYKYFKEDGSGYKIGWHFDYNADGSKIWYYLDDAENHKEYMVTGWKKIARGDGVFSWYHFRVDGKMSRYWEYLKEKWYYLEPTDDAGYMITDWLMINDNWYYFLPGDSDGNMMIGWHEIRGKWYYFYNTDEKRGIMAHDYLMRHTDGKLYFLQEKNDGSMAVNKQITDPATGIVYYADKNGVCTEGASGPWQESISPGLQKYYDNNNNLIGQITQVNVGSKFDYDLNNFAKIYNNNLETYEKISQETGVPAKLIAALHYRESSGNFNTYLHNGQKLGTVTTIVPKGRIFYNFHDGAVDALLYEQKAKGIYLTPNSGIVMMMTFAEIYNGTGYTNYRGIASPYVYSGTDVYVSGKYVSDGTYSATTVDKQPGVYLLVTSV
ncbi:N-acetylmuramoyl-L-alanine amidase family protein [Lacrimispora brassicae]